MFDPTCQICGTARLSRISGFEHLPRVTSDCKPWPAGGTLVCCDACGAIQKEPHQVWREEIRAIYDAYEIYHLSNGSEQVIFSPGTGPASPRSQLLVEFLKQSVDLPAKGRLLDIGCGNGAALATFSQALPPWRLFGSELNDRALPLLSRLPNFDTLYTCDPAAIPGSFDLVSMIHSLEHMPDSHAAIRAAADRLSHGGLLFIEVPDIASSPFDLVVADHLLHLTIETLGHLSARAGLAPLVLTNHALSKELTLLARDRQDAAPKRPDPAVGRKTAESIISWLTTVLEHARSVAAASRLGIFGTSISGMWLFGALRDRVAFFVDEDPTRIGGSFDGRPILAPAAVPAGSIVYLALVPSVANAIAKRLADLAADFIVPPPFPV